MRSHFRFNDILASLWAKVITWPSTPVEITKVGQRVYKTLDNIEDPPLRYPYFSLRENFTLLLLYLTTNYQKIRFTRWFVYLLVVA